MNLSRLLLPLMLAVLAGCAGTKSPDSKNLTTNSQGRYIARDTSRTVDLTNPPADAWDRIRRGFAIPNLNTDLSQQWTDYYAAHPESVQRMAERAGKYLYFIVDEINRRGLPTELALLPFVESAYNPTALSRSQASGLWQFVPATGQHFNLKQDWWRDERRDPIASTNAALDYLEKLFEMQGDWYLALASYNWGEGSVQRAMAKNEAAGLRTDYLSLSMPDETRNYVPKLQAIKNIIADPQRYAVALPPVGNTPYFVTVQKNSDIDLEIAAKLAEMPLDEFKALNPSFNRPLIRGDHGPTLLLPADRVEIFNANLTNYKGDLSAWKVYHTRRGESYASIAKRFGVTESRLRQINDIGSRQKSASGQSLLVPGDSAGNVQLASLAPPVLDAAPAAEKAPATRGRAQQAPAARVASARVASARPNVRTHKVRQGDTLYSLAKQYGTSIDALRALNNLKGSALKVGTPLRVPGTNARG
ncbi:lytic transglycosylase [Achromobacter sp. HZ01]|jgi:membrane-bound lytic murein transglycosylase D|uniref:Lytic transglycosylase n=1 Tax=Achromobacter pulmonis TaxID=1389932 RepID=A0A2N8KAN5_9BURK|nr:MULTISPECIES: transglycosylase SLT domain-containing protein [Achromobacter]MBO9329903.1 transglycosylase SLT domain-containing protein [Achromobacter xylosoxidans]PND30516.1 lytic transglycosylase [Achromobacter pulmonis]RAP60605.1 lytic transglycosylase [Achromobacter sp. HZ01]